MHYVGKINKRLYSCVTTDISTDELIITEKQVEHIFQNHPNDFIDLQDVLSSIQEAAFSPDYIIESDKPSTAFILKELSNQKGKSRLIMRIKTSSDSMNYKNSIITFQKVREKEWKRIINNKKILYKSE
ncbi:PBECR2 nuclease fold domain-containing protein [Ruminococcus sp. JL13D9]|uniref:PBECR2 nuclease fold domain-containing protein n=1 Tax=Ruminococcus sp. JL13D9 TaxID=3233381 RepID=UPI00389B348F